MRSEIRHWHKQLGSWPAQAEARMDPESLERENDKDIDSLAEKTSFLRQVGIAAVCFNWPCHLAS